MSVLIRLCGFVVTACIWAVTSAAPVQQVTWQDLGTIVQPSDDPFFGLTFEQKKSLETVLKLAKLRKKGSQVDFELIRQESQARKNLAQSGLDADQMIKQEENLFAKLRLQQSSLREDLNGQDILVPGYVRPLEFDGINNVTEFLLVPYAGACVHTPPPPPNQIIHVKVNQGFAIDGMFTPVWVSGTLHTGISQQQVELSDGESEFGVGYKLDGELVEFYR